MIILKKIFSSVTSKIIILNVLVLIIASIISLFIGQEAVFGFLGLTPSLIMKGQNLWTIITSIFMHAGVLHLFFNMISLSFIGLFIERIIGKKRFLFFYLIAGIFAGIFFVLLAYFFGNSELGARLFGSPDIIGVGASGAIFGLVGLIAVLTPKNKVYLIAGPLIAIIVDAISGNLFNENIANVISIICTIYIVFAIFFMFSFNPRKRRLALPIEMPFWLLPIVAIVPLVIIGLFVKLPIGNSAHLGGLIIGLIYGFYLKKKYPKKTAFITRVFSK